MRHLDQVAIEPARQAAIGGNHDDQHPLFGTNRQQRLISPIRTLARRLGYIRQHLLEHLRVGTGPRGRTRRASSNADRVRVAVTRRIRAAIAQIAKHHAPLGMHLTASIRTGYSCSYAPADQLVWRT